jgi:hypothetical protein
LTGKAGNSQQIVQDLPRPRPPLALISAINGPFRRAPQSINVPMPARSPLKAA